MMDKKRSTSFETDRASIWQERDPEDERDAVAPVASDSMKINGWQLFGASRRGKSHAHAGTYREDAFSLTVIDRGTRRTWWVIAVADGAGSCKWSRVGANLAVTTVSESLQRANFSNSSALKCLDEAASSALASLKLEAEQRNCPLSDLSCTLLILLWIPSPDGIGGLAVTFQAGDGLIACADGNGTIEQLACQDGEAFAGTTHFLTSGRVTETWDSRFECFFFPESPVGLLVMSDGVADDLVPYERNGPTIVRELFGIRDSENPGMKLVDVLGYEKRGSFDDRTLVCGIRSDKRFLEREEPTASPRKTE